MGFGHGVRGDPWTAAIGAFMKQPRLIFIWSKKRMKPSVGRIVHYVSYGTSGGEYLPEHRAAIVTEAPSSLPTSPYDNEPVGLCVLNPTGLFLNRHIFHDEKTKAPGTWHWPEHVE